MINKYGSLDNPEVFIYSDTDLSSFGSSESDSDVELPMPADINSNNKFFKEKTPEVSNHVLNFDESSIKTELETNYLEMKKSQDQLIEETSDVSIPTSNLQLFSQEVQKSKVKTGVYQQIKQANNELDKVQEKLFHFFDGINKFGEIFADLDDNKDNEKATQTKEISDQIQQSQSNPSFSCDEASEENQPQAFNDLCSQVYTVMNEFTSIMNKLNELLEM